MDRKTLGILAAVIGLVIVLSGMCLVVGGVVYVTQRAEARQLPDAPPLPNPVPPGPPAPTDDTRPPVDDRARYRPGPYVRVVGTLPEGRLEVERMQGTWRDGRTIENPWVVGGAELRPAAAPSASGSDAAPALTRGNGDNGQAIAVVPGVPNRLGMRAEPGDGHSGVVSGLYIAFHDYPGHFYLPASADTELGHVMVAGIDNAEVHFGIDAAVRPGGAPITGTEPFAVQMYIAAEDLEGRVSPYVTRQLLVQPVGSGDVDITVTMNQPTDLDLYVVDPTGSVVYYGNRTSTTGGQLDLDANAACNSNMGVNAEHIYWSQGTARAGTYTVRVAHFESCVSGAQVNYQVTIGNCGETVVFEGSFEGEGNTAVCEFSPGQDRNWCQDVVEFEVTPCHGD